MKLQIPDKLLPLLKPVRFKSIEGGRGSAKSHTVARLFIVMAYSRKVRILCCREIQKSIKGSVKQTLEDVAKEFGLESQFRYANGELTCLRTGSVFMFSGLRDHTVDSIKSIEGLDYVWIEEAQKVSKRSWQILTPTIRKSGSEIWATWNPDLESDEVFQMVHAKPWLPAQDMLVLKINYMDNPWFPEVLRAQLETMKAANNDLYLHVWEGHLRSSAGLLFKRQWLEDARYDPDELPQYLTKYVSSDYASADLEDLEDEGEDRDPDWTEFGVWGMDEDNVLWGLDWWSGQTDPAVWIKALGDLFKKHEPQRYFEESGVIYRATKGAFNTHMRKRGLFVPRQPMPSTGSKADRALGFAMLCAQGLVRLPRGVKWADDLIDQLCAFTGLDGRVDDKVDACSKLGQGLDNVAPAIVPDVKKRRTIRPGSVQHLEQDTWGAEQEERRRAYNEA